jgi:hypothetical protein
MTYNGKPVISSHQTPVDVNIFEQGAYPTSQLGVGIDMQIRKMKDPESVECFWQGWKLKDEGAYRHVKRIPFHPLFQVGQFYESLEPGPRFKIAFVPDIDLQIMGFSLPFTA